MDIYVPLIGKIASGGISDTAVISGLSGAAIRGIAPAARPTIRPMNAAIDTPFTRRDKLLCVSRQNKYSPLRLLGSSAIRSMALAISVKLGSSLSCSFSALRMPEPI